jgi:hypothetical protein
MRRAIIGEVEEIGQQAGRSSRAQFGRARTWSIANLALGVPAVILAALAGSILIADWTDVWLPGLLALVSAALMGVLLGLAPARRARQAADAGNDFIALRDSTRRLSRLDLPAMEIAGARQALEQLAARHAELNHKALVPGKRLEPEEGGWPEERAARADEGDLQEPGREEPGREKPGTRRVA